jgi:hypothetical protein
MLVFRPRAIGALFANFLRPGFSKVPPSMAPWYLTRARGAKHAAVTMPVTLPLFGKQTARRIFTKNVGLDVEGIIDHDED